MKKLILVSLLILSASLPVGAKERAVAQQSNNNPFGAQTGSTDSSGSFTTEDVVSSGARVNQVLCLGGPSTYPLGVSGPDITVRRVSNGGDIRYEVLKGTRFVGACAMVHVIGN